MMCYEMYSDVAYVISIYCYIQICFDSIVKTPCVSNGSTTFWHIVETVD